MEDHFDRLPDCLLLDILDRLSDAKSLVRCLSVSSRFRSLVPLATSLRLLVDRVVPPSPSPSLFDSFAAFLNLFFPLPFPPPSSPYSSPSSVLRGFRCVRHLDIQLPSPVTLNDNGSTFLRYRATFGETLEECVMIVGFRGKEGKEGAGREVVKAADEEGEVKERVFWVIRALVDACKRHNYAARELIREHQGLASLRMSDAAGEGVVEMGKRGLEECRKCPAPREGCRVPRVKMQMRYGRKTEVQRGGEVFEGATLVVVRTMNDDGTRDWPDGDDAARATDAFGSDGGYKEAVGELMKNRSYSLEINSFLI
ncbi:hypothetical protein MLD38_001667 [Melastoma candidum]|uniref:Uncharacterized protein n=1 Tax=Melastoma candidum TaxID=119954 RepID=A0ACB9SED5_9MYRT|nr:hypothetical protein MLD38_001667 [Melastoma candidum]